MQSAVHVIPVIHRTHIFENSMRCLAVSTTVVLAVGLQCIAENFSETRNLKYRTTIGQDMTRSADWDADTLYLVLEQIGVNMRELDKQDPSLQYLRELYDFLLYSQLLAWKSGKSHRLVIRAVNQQIVDSRAITTAATRHRL